MEKRTKEIVALGNRSYRVTISAGAELTSRPADLSSHGRYYRRG